MTENKIYPRLKNLKYMTYLNEVPLERHCKKKFLFLRKRNRKCYFCL